MPSRLLKMKMPLPFHVEYRLVHKWGYVIEKRLVGDFVLFKKSYISDKALKDEGVKRTIRASVNDKIVYPDFNGLTTQQKKALEKRCDNIVNFFPDPYSVPESVRTRLKIIMQRLTMPEAQFVLEYMDENFPAVDKGE